MSAREKRLTQLEAATQQWAPSVNPDPCPKAGVCLMRPHTERDLPIPPCEACGRVHDYRVIIIVHPSRTMPDSDAPDG